MSWLNRIMTPPGSGYAETALQNEERLAGQVEDTYNEVSPLLRAYGERLISGVNPARQARYNGALATGQRTLRTGLGAGRMALGSRGLGAPGGSLSQGMLASLLSQYGRDVLGAESASLADEEQQRAQGYGVLAGLANPSLLSSLYEGIGQAGAAQAGTVGNLFGQLVGLGVQQPWLKDKTGKTGG